MADPIPIPLLKALRQELASGIADAKAYDVPGLCVRLGLPDGTEQEAYSSKFKYASKRLAEVDATTALEAAKRLLAEEDSFGLAEVVAKIEETAHPRVSELTRRRIVSVFEGRALCTEIEHIELLRNLWPIASMPSPYSRPGFEPLPLDEHIIQHTIRNDGWSNRELLEVLGILKCSQRQFFRFLEAVVDPIVQTPEGQASLVEAINGHLKHDGYTLTVAKRVSGSPVYEVRPSHVGTPADAAISAALLSFDPDHVHQRWEAALERRATDPAGAITLARTLLEDVSRWVLSEAGQDAKESDDLPALYRKLSKVLRLAPDDHTEQVFRQILGSCQSVVESLGSFRNKLSDAHSPGPKRARAQPRHAELAVNLAGTMATFLVATWRARQTSSAGLACVAAMDSDA